LKTSEIQTQRNSNELKSGAIYINLEEVAPIRPQCE
jgi:hypothetical protein